MSKSRLSGILKWPGALNITMITLFIINEGCSVTVLKWTCNKISNPHNLQIYKTEVDLNLKFCEQCALSCTRNGVDQNQRKCAAFGCQLSDKRCDYYEKSVFNRHLHAQTELFALKVTDVFHPVSVGGRVFSIFMSSTKRNYLKARAHCEALGAYLYHFDSPDEYDAIHVIASKQLEAESYVGANDMATEGMWVSERGAAPLTADTWQWRPGEPSDGDPSLSEDCAVIEYSDMKLNDVFCEADLAFLCKRDTI